MILCQNGKECGIFSYREDNNKVKLICRPFGCYGNYIIELVKTHHSKLSVWNVSIPLLQLNTGNSIYCLEIEEIAH